MQYIKATSDASFEEDVLNSDLPVLVDFWADWCQPCKMLAPVLNEVAKDFMDRLHFFKINVDDNVDIPARYGVRGIPTLLIFKEGQVVGTKVGGAWSKSQLSSFIENLL